MPIQFGTFTSSLKSAVVKPLLNKPTLKQLDFNNYLPISIFLIFNNYWEVVHKPLIGYLATEYRIPSNLVFTPTIVETQPCSKCVI